MHYVHIGLGRGYMASIMSYFAMLRSRHEDHEADLIVEDFAAPFSTALSPLWSDRPTIAMVQWLNGRESRQYKLPFFLVERLGVRMHRRFIAVSEDLADKLRAGNRNTLVEVVPNGVEPGAFHAGSDRQADHGATSCSWAGWRSPRRASTCC